MKVSGSDDSMIAAMMALRHFLLKYDIPMPEGVEIKFKLKSDKHRFDAAMKHSYSPLISPYVSADVERGGPIDKIAGIPFEATHAEKPSEYDQAIRRMFG